MPVPELQHLREGLQPAGHIISGDIGARGEDVGPSIVVGDETGSSTRVVKLVAGSGGPVLKTDHLRVRLVPVVPAQDHQALRREPAGVVSPVGHGPAQASPLPGLQVHGHTVVPGEVVRASTDEDAGLTVILVSW